MKQDVETLFQNVVRRRAFLAGVGAAAAVLPASPLLATVVKADGGELNQGDVAILEFLAAAEIIEADLWQQYNELGGVEGGNPAYQAALQNLTATCRSTSPTTPTTSSAMQPS